MRIFMTLLLGVLASLADAGAREIYLLIGQSNMAGQLSKVELISQQVAAQPAEVPQTAFASSEGLTCMDRGHFDPKSMKLRGERYADAILQWQKK
jgi:hypothetical protein